MMGNLTVFKSNLDRAKTSKLQRWLRHYDAMVADDFLSSEEQAVYAAKAVILRNELEKRNEANEERPFVCV